MRFIHLILIITVTSLSSCQHNGGADNTSKQSDSDKTDSLEKNDAKEAANLPEVEEEVIEDTNKTPPKANLDKVMKVKMGKAKDTLKPSAALPDFSAIKESEKRKEQFVKFVKPLVNAENQQILQQRFLIKQIYASIQEGKALSDKDEKWLNAIAKKYRVENRNFPEKEAFLDLLLHVDIIPQELAVAQAANESAWGTSRFARMGNNLFGQWCFNPGCGIVPAQRKEGAKHEVAAFPSVAGSVKSYMHHVNSHPAYEKLRVLRYQLRLEGKEPDGRKIAVGLQKYSAIGMEYVNILRSMMGNIAKYS